MNYRWRSRPSYARSEAIRYRVRACVRACVHNIRMWRLFSPGSRATRGRSKIDLVPSLKGIERRREELRSVVERRGPIHCDQRENREGRFIWGEEGEERSRSRGRKEAVDIFLSLFFEREERAISRRFFFFWVCFRRCVTSRIFIARIRRKIDGLLTACND